jgi:hypothetical protein
MIWRRYLVLAVLALVAFGSLATAQAGGVAATAPASSHPDGTILSKYCFACHNSKSRAGGLALDSKDLTQVSADADVWEKVVRKLRMGSMPPPGMPRPDNATADAFVLALEAQLDREAAQHPNPGRTEALHRLNRAEYKNAVRDLLALDIDTTALLPPDDADTRGLDNNASLLSVSPALLDRYLIVARRVSRQALGLPPAGPGSDTFKISTYAAQENQGRDLPFGTRGGAAITYAFPVDGEYVISVRLRRSLYGYIMGLQDPEQIEVRVDGVRVKTFKVGGEDHGMTAPRGFAGEFDGGPDWERWAHEADTGLDVRVPVKAGPRVVSVAFVGRAARPQDALIRAHASSGLLQRDDTRMQAVDTIGITGPYGASERARTETPSLRKILLCRPTSAAQEEPCARRILTSMARQAYRRPITGGEVQTLMDFYRDGRKGGDFVTGLQVALSCILASPDFLFRVEHDPARAVPGSAYRISDLELASRLSFFLWSSIPDKTLLDLADKGTLHQPAVLRQQVGRMIADPRSEALVDNFVGQWLLLRDLRTAAPDVSLFPGFDEALLDAYEQETKLFFNDQIQRNQSVVELLSARYTFLNETLAKQYGIPNIFGTRFRRVDLPADSPRGGLLGQGALLMVTSYPNRTSPVLRGKWVLTSLLGTPPPQPPPNVPGLKDKGEGGKPATVRARLEAHRKNPFCASCHTSMDPLGFALENFDAAGNWRTIDAGAPIDSSGVLPNGTEFVGPVGLRNALLARKEQFVQAMTEHLLAYALGRQLEAYDMPTVRKIVYDARADDYRWRSIISGIVKSEPFLMRTAAPKTRAVASIAAGDGQIATALK